ncbi:hypothetical protein LTSEALA_2064, partial [Salmonella enterica subsp. enterica serovar Alachua str. R6-377]
SGTPPRGKFIMLLAFYSGKDYSELKLLTLRAVACGNSSPFGPSGTPPRGNA